ncbi:helix-turn-helix domain-containing protein [Peribacillus sp. SCS-26]|uniref:helix-turn-helix domain-containing protein n=1 Tax=Paraperibacillus marinus TaxID=3115295 RepID=UPI0039060219
MKFKITSMELMKILADPRRSKILHLAMDKPVTVKYLAEQIGEDPLKLYYHVKKMVKHELLEVVETVQHGNLTEKYYQAINLDVIYRGNLDEQSEASELALSLARQKIDPGLRLYQKALEKVREDKKEGRQHEILPYHVSINSGTDRITGRQWRRSMETIIETIGGEKLKIDEWPELPPHESDSETGTYQYVLISYKIEDADKLGLILPEEDEDGK